MKYLILLSLSLFLSSCAEKVWPEWVPEPTPENTKKFLQEKRKEFVFVQGGEFLMGDSLDHDTIQFGTTLNWDSTLLKPDEFGMRYECWHCKPDSRHQHKAKLNSYYIAKFEVTWKDYDFFFRHSGKKKPAQAEIAKKVGKIKSNSVTHNVRGPNYPISTSLPGIREPNYPASTQDWNYARDYCLWLGKQMKLPIDLPTEAQWEYAARSRGGPMPFATNSGYMRKGINMGGKREDDSCRRCDEPLAYPVGHFPPNPLGLYDMSGNMHEWVLDWYDEDYYLHSPYLNPQGPKKGTQKITRGGGDNQSNYANNVFNRYERQYPKIIGKYDSPESQDFTQDGMRCVINAKKLP